MKSQSGEDEESREAARTRRSLRLWILAGVVFAATVFGYSGVMVYLAQRDYPGSVVHNYFENYERFNQYAQALEKRRNLDWAIATRLESLPVADRRLKIKTVARGPEGEPLTGGKARVHFIRSIKATKDAVAELQEVAEGTYVGHVSLPEPGNWTMRTTVTQGDSQYTVQRCLWLERPLE